MRLFDENGCAKICLLNKNPYVALAVEDLRRDFARVSAGGFLPEVVCEEADGCVVIGENTVEGAEPVESEGFSIKTRENRIYIDGDGYLGTMWGIYTFSERYLGVDPCYLFGDLETAKRDALDIPDINVSERPGGFGFRGLFINDEDLLTGWKTGGVRYADYWCYGLTVSECAMNMVVETALRLKLNLMIPASLVNVDDPAEKTLADCVARRGIYLSQHHIEPVGVSAFSFDFYLKKFKKSGKFSFAACPELMKEIWRYYAEKWSRYDNVVWQIGLRGMGDRPVWQDAVPTEDEMRGYGDLIGKAMACQKEIIEKATGGRARHFTSTLWMEGSKLMEMGALTIPDGTVMVFADNGPNQMFGKDFRKTERKDGARFGIYYHVQFFDDGPHLAPQTGIDKLYYNIKLAHDTRCGSYCILNSSNMREFTFELSAYSMMLWDTDGFSKEDFLKSYCAAYGSVSEKMEKLIGDYYEAVPALSANDAEKYWRDVYYNYDYEDAPEGIKNFAVKDGRISSNLGRKLLRNIHADIGSERDMYGAYAAAAAKALPAYDALIQGFEDAARSASSPVKRHIEVKWLCYSVILRGLYRWYSDLYGAKVAYDEMRSADYVERLERACDALREAIEYRKRAEYGEFENWYRGDVKIDMKRRLDETLNLLGRTVSL